jgi:L-glyceraldehyde 3-phosphate reductase
MLNRWIERDNLLDTLAEVGAGCIAFSPLAQGVLTDRYRHGIPPDSRMRTSRSINENHLNELTMAKVAALTEIAGRRRQSLAQLAIVWALRDPRMTSVVLGVSSVAQLNANIAALDHLALTPDELAKIEKYATEAGINIWA